MSAFVPRCERCLVDCVFVRAAPFQGPQCYGVEWRCPRCVGNTLDICPVGPLVPSAQTCLNCGVAYDETGQDAGCPGCGLTRAGALEALGLSPMPPDAIGSIGALMKSGLIRRAMAIANLTIEADPKNQPAWRTKYSLLFNLHFFESALFVLDGFIANVDDPELVISRGFLLQTMQRHAEAVKTYDRFLREAPDGPSADVAWSNMANSLRELRDDVGAERAYREAIRKNPSRATHYANFCRLLYDHKRYDEAHTIVDQGLGCAEDPPMVRRLLEDKSLLFAEQMKGDESLRYADKAIERGADGVRVHYLRGRALALLGQLKDARREILRVIELDSNNADGLRALAMIEEGVGIKKRRA